MVSAVRDMMKMTGSKYCAVLSIALASMACIHEDYGGATPYAMALFKAGDGEPNHTFRTYPIFHYSVRPVLEIKK